LQNDVHSAAASEILKGGPLLPVQGHELALVLAEGTAFRRDG